MKIYHDSNFITVRIVWSTIWGECTANAQFLKYIDHIFDPENSEWLYKIEFINEFGVTVSKNVKVRTSPENIIKRLMSEYVKN